MKWRLKSGAFRVLSAIQGGEAVYRFVQANITRSIRPTRSRMEGKLCVALDYWAWIAANGHEDAVREGTHLDFGAGWHPTIPLTFHALGVKRQRLLDLEPLMKAPLIRKTAGLLQKNGLALMKEAGFPAVQPEPFVVTGQSADELFGSVGISYHAPYDGLLPRIAGEASLVTSTQVLLHIPEPILAKCFAELFQALKPGGLFLATIHLQPLYGGLTNSTSAYRHLRYSPEEWERLGSKIMYYTRLKAPDYRRLLEKAGFEIPGWVVQPGSEKDYAAVKALPVHACFSGYSTDDLAARHLFFSAQKPL